MVKRTICLLLTVCTSGMLYAGDLNPPAAPASTMKTLEEVEPRTPIHAADLPLVITESGSYYLAEPVYFDKETNAAITIQSDNVSIDLCGFTLRGTYKCNYGIYCAENQQVKVHNGFVRTFKLGSVHLLGYRSTLKGITAGLGDVSLRTGLDAVVESCQVYYPDTDGIRVGINSLVKNCVVNDHYDPGCKIGIYVDENSNVVNCNVRYAADYGIFLASYSNAVDCVVSEADKCGVWSSSGSKVSGCVTYSCPTGIRSEENGTIKDNVVNTPSDYGIYCGYNVSITGNKVNGGIVGIGGYNRNTILDNSINGATTAIQFDSLNVIERNRIFNVTTGLDMTGHDNLYLQNRLNAATAFLNESDDKNGGDNIQF